MFDKQISRWFNFSPDIIVTNTWDYQSGLKEEEKKELFIGKSKYEVFIKSINEV